MAMELNDFKIGHDFWMSGKQYRCTDIGTRIIAAIHLDPTLTPDWFRGPTYAVVEYVIDEDDFGACTEGKNNDL